MGSAMVLSLPWPAASKATSSDIWNCVLGPMSMSLPEELSKMVVRMSREVAAGTNNPPEALSKKMLFTISTSKPGPWAS